MPICKFNEEFSEVNLVDVFSPFGIHQHHINSGTIVGTLNWAILDELSIISSVNPSTNEVLARVSLSNVSNYNEVVEICQKAQVKWRNVPAPMRASALAKFKDDLIKHKNELAMIITMEVGKILPESLGEVQELIDVCDYAIGLSRMLNGQVIPSERPQHLMLEMWNPLGIVGIISAFNFPMAVFGWNAALALVTGNAVIWKPSPAASLCAIAVMRLLGNALNAMGHPEVCALICGCSEIGCRLSEDHRIALLSFTGSTAVGRVVGCAIQKRFGKSILELGGNNAIIVLKDANMEIAIRSVLFAAVGTCGQRCTSARRLLLHDEIYDEFVERLSKAYAEITVGYPWKQNICGPLNNPTSVTKYQEIISQTPEQGGKIIFGGKVFERNFVCPTIIAAPHAFSLAKEEAFVPILFVFKFANFQEAVALNNAVNHGLSSSLFTADLAKAMEWIGPNGSDCGIVNVNIPTSGAEIGGAFGGEKDTGGGRESGSDSWKQYVRRSTCTINYSNDIPLAQGIKFE